MRTSAEVAVAVVTVADCRVTSKQTDASLLIGGTKDFIKVILDCCSEVTS